MIVKNAAEDVRIVIEGTQLQCGLVAPRNIQCLCSLSKAYFFLKDSAGSEIGVLEKRGRGFKSVVTDAENFSVTFPLNATAEDRCLLLAATLFLDFRLFVASGEKGDSSGVNINI